VAIRYRLINDPLQIYLMIVCFWMILTGRMPSTRKIWSQVPRSGELSTVGIKNADGETPGTADPLPEPVALLAMAGLSAEPALVKFGGLPPEVELS